MRQIRASDFGSWPAGTARTPKRFFIMSRIQPIDFIFFYGTKSVIADDDGSFLSIRKQPDENKMITNSNDDFSLIFPRE
jgi:hypothetical protein